MRNRTGCCRPSQQGSKSPPTPGGHSGKESKNSRRPAERRWRGTPEGTETPRQRESERGGWSPQGLALLPKGWLDALGRMIGDCETAGKLPEAMRNVVFSMTPKPRAETEAGLRPIGLIPYVCRAWMAIRKGQSKDRLLRLHETRYVGASALAANPRASIEVMHYQVGHNLLAFLDCSNCYERVGHTLAGARALQSGLAARVANIIFDMYKGHRYIKAHGAVARPRTGGHGLAAGCAFAKDTPKAFLTPIKEECPRGKPRDYSAHPQQHSPLPP